MSARNIRKMMDIAKKRFNLRKAALNERYASNENRFHAVLIHFEDEAALNLVKEKMLLFEGADELRALIEAGNVWGALEKEIEMYNEILKIVDSESFSEDFKRIYFKNDFNYHDFIESLRAGKSELEENLASFKSRVEEEGAWIADQIRSEMHRAMLHNGVAVLVAVLILTSGILGLTAFGLPYFYAANITAAVVSNLTTWSLGVGLAGGTIDMINIILDKMIGQKGFRKIEGILRTLEKEPSCTEPQSNSPP